MTVSNASDSAANGTWTISNLTATSFTLTGTSTSSTSGSGGTWSLANGSAATFTSTNLPVGTDSILAIYNNALSGSISAASNPGPIVITTNSTAALASGEAVYVYGVGGNTAANGFWTINVLNGTQFALVGSSGNGTYTGGGAWLLEANYSGSYSTTPDSFVVNPASTTISSFQATVNGSTASSSTFGEPITLQATVSSVAPVTATPTGSVTFKNGSTILATVNLVNGVASWTTTSSTYLNAGTYSNITATYNPSIGPQDFQTTTAATLSTFTVNPAQTTVTSVVSSYPLGYTYGTYPYLTFTATVAPTTPTGSITAASDSSAIVITTSSTADLSTGSTVAVSGVLGNPAANGTWTITVLSATTFALNGSVGNGTYTSGGSWTSVIPAAFTGSVEFFLNGSAVGSAAVNPYTGVATYTDYATQIPVGNYTVTAQYQGVSGSISAVTNYPGYPVLISTTSTAGLTSGQQVTISGAGNIANGNYYVYVFNGSIFGLYSDASLTSPVIASGTFTSGGTWTANDYQASLVSNGISQHIGSGSTTNLTTSTTSATYGQTVTLTANVAGSPGQAPNSTVTFLLSGNGYSNYSLGSVSLGAGSITAATNYAGYPTLFSTASTAGLTSGQQVTISGVGTVANGTYSVYVFSATLFGLYTDSSFTSPVIGTGTYTSGGTWTANDVSVATLNVNTSAIPINTSPYSYYTITAQYGGDSFHSSSSGTSYLVVTPSPTTTTITPASGTSSPATHGTSDSFIATVLSTGAGTPGAPLGSVTFYVNSVAQQTVNLSTLSSSISGTSPSGGSPSPVVVTTASTAGLANGDQVTVSNASDSAANGTWTISNLTATSFTLTGTSTSSTSGSGGTWTLANGSAATFTSTSLPVGTDSILAIYNNALTSPIIAASNAGPIVITTNSTADLASGEAVYVYGVGGNTAANGFWTINVLNGTQFTLLDSNGNGTYTGGGTWLLEPNYSSSYSISPLTFVVN